LGDCPYTGEWVDTVDSRHRKGPTDISPLTWVLIVAGGWLCLAAVVGVVVGRVIRNRDRQIPTDAEPRPTSRRPDGSAGAPRDTPPAPQQRPSRMEP
jgi:hypothetical protein